MKMPESQSLIALWGAALSTLLAVLKLWEFWRKRFRVEVGSTLRGGASLGNTIRIRNLSGEPIIVSSWEVLYVKGYWPFRKFQEIASPDHDSCDCRIEPRSTFELNFNGQDFFSWSHESLQGRRIFIRIYIAGHGSVLKLVHSS